MVPLIIVLLIFGIILLCIEIIMPGFGVPGITGGAMLLASAVLSTWFMQGFYLWLIWIIFAAAIIIMIILIKRKRVLNRLVLKESLNEKNFNPETIYHLMGKIGVTQSPLKPYGVVDFGGELREAFSEMGYIEKGKHVVCVSIQGRNIIVREKVLSE